MGDIATQVGIDVKGMVGTFSRIFHKMGVANGIYASNKYDELKQAIEQNG